MKESRIEATPRLQREGRWAEASLFRDQVRSRLRAEGKTRAEANDAAWEAMTEAYPPLPEEPSDAVDGPLSEEEEQAFSAFWDRCEDDPIVVCPH